MTDFVIPHPSLLTTSNGLTHSFNQQVVLSTHFVLGIVVGTRGIMVNKTGMPLNFNNENNTAVANIYHSYCVSDIML